MIPDRCATVPPHLPGDGSGEVAADRVLHIQRFTLPLGLNTAAQPRLGRRPPPATVLTNEHHPPPTLHDMAERPQIRVDRARSNASSRSCSNRTRSASDKAARTCLTRSGSSGPIGGSAPLTPWLLAFQTNLPLRNVTASARASRHAHPRRRWASPSWSGRSCPNAAGRASPTVIPPEYRQHHPTLGDWHNPPTARPMLHPRCSAVLTGK